MKSYDVQSIEIRVPFEDAVTYISDASRLPEWTRAFQDVREGRARMVTPEGAVDVDLKVDVSPECGAIDWTMTFPDGTRERAFSRVVPLSEHSVVYAFVLTVPPAHLERLEGGLDRQSATLREELERLKRILEK
jgi:hypothetical protein